MKLDVIFDNWHKPIFGQSIAAVGIAPLAIAAISGWPLPAILQGALLTTFFFGVLCWGFSNSSVRSPRVDGWGIRAIGHPNSTITAVYLHLAEAQALAEARSQPEGDLFTVVPLVCIDGQFHPVHVQA